MSFSLRLNLLKAINTQPATQSSIPGTQVVGGGGGGGEHQLLQPQSYPLTSTCLLWHTGFYTHTNTHGRKISLRKWMYGPCIAAVESMFVVFESYRVRITFSMFIFFAYNPLKMLITVQVHCCTKCPKID